MKLQGVSLILWGAGVDKIKQTSCSEIRLKPCEIKASFSEIRAKALVKSYG